jgi:uncharacterized protein (TIGR02145 family)
MKNNSVVLLLLLFGSCESDEPVAALPKPIPASPIDLIISSASDVQISLFWTDNSTNEEGFVIERKVGSEGFVELAHTKEDETLFNDDSVQPETQYSYRVYAYNSGGKSESYTNVVSAITLPSISVELTTLPVTFVGSSSAVSDGIVNPNASPPIIVSGFVWSTSASPTISLATKTIAEADVYGKFGSILTGLSAGNTYFVRAYATTDKGTTYGNEVSFTTLSQPLFKNGSGVTDADGNAYPTVIIGDQEWLGENLRTTKFSDGTEIANKPNDESGAWWHYDVNNHPSIAYGNFYNIAVIQDPKNVCPTGWHVPTTGEWTELADALGGANIAGMRLRAVNSGWTFHATNESGFNALPARSFNWFPHPDNNAVWWTVTQGEISGIPNQHMMVDMYDSSTAVQIASNTSSNGAAFTVRCLKDDGN